MQTSRDDTAPENTLLRTFAHMSSGDFVAQAHEALGRSNDTSSKVHFCES